MQRRTIVATASVGLALGWLSGCATVQQLGVEVRSFGEWPSGRAPGTYAFDRLPSQQAIGGPALQALEAAAAEALQAKGFRAAPPGTAPDVLVQLGQRVNRSDMSPWDDPLWWRGGWSTWRPGLWAGPVWGPRLRWRESPQYDRQVALLLRDRTNGQPLYEAHASSAGFADRIEALLQPMFRAALSDFPAPRPEPRMLRVPY
jgi:hypothetical protein